MGKGEFYATAAGLLLFGQSPADHFPQAAILADAYVETKVSGNLTRSSNNLFDHLLHTSNQIFYFICLWIP